MSITIYTRNNCVQCHATKRAMESRGFEFEMVNVDLVPDAADTLRAQGFRQLPVVMAGDLSWSAVALFFFFFKQKTAYEMHILSRGLGDVYKRQGDLSWSGFRPDMINRLHPTPHAANA